MKRVLCFGLAMLASALAGAAPASAQSYPAREVRIVVPYPPGGGADYLARAIGDALAKRIGQPVIVDNRGGGNTLIGTEHVVRSPADGYTLLLGSSALAISPSIYRKMPYDALKDLAPIGRIGAVPLLLVANPASGIGSVNDLIAKAQAQPGKVSFASYGSGSAAHLAAELFQFETKVKLLHVPYKGSAPALTDLLAGRVDVMFSTIGPAQPHVETGALRALGVTSSQPVETLPGVPPIAQAGVPGYEAAGWNALLAPAGTPKAIVERINRELLAILAEPEIREGLVKRGYIVEGSSPAELSALIASDTAKWKKVVQESGAKLD